MRYQEPLATTVAADRRGDTARIVLHAERVPSPPIAPAALYDQDNPAREIFPLHKLAGQSGDHLTFEAYEVVAALPPIGARFILRSWWTADALAAVIDRAAVWVRQAYPDNGDHDHCLLTWEPIAADATCSEGYRSRHGWITTAAYEQYIQRDVLRLRGVEATGDASAR
ncbi:MAG: hypothetical protein AVDCRST_MAG88-1933 [uncultured Thermomicrobiales bacterium]|uniref:Uncharacterized protein n=1 Tax=uncultured Thermomicrobiales bacterium TaxID=1645740 RepID=A0A6J4V141_9BACT|nr:MAG: hypothetical protein AVDCRST_MAG88-1933 [uncultured Thermomicrobiales bacterium]